MLLPERGVRVPVPDEKPKNLKGVVRPSIPTDCVFIAQNMRKDDLMELKAGGHEDALFCMVDCFERTDRPLTALWNDKPFCMFGIVRVRHRCYDASGKWLSKGIGAPWMLGTDGIMEARWQFLRESAYWLNQIKQDYDILWNRVHSKNTVHIKWLKWLGFDFGDEVVYPSGEVFINFSKADRNVHY